MSEDHQTYYQKNREARMAYQKEYYRKMREHILRKLELDRELNPEKVERARVYQREYYLKNRRELLVKKQAKYAERKARLRGITVEEYLQSRGARMPKTEQQTPAPVEANP